MSLIENFKMPELAAEQQPDFYSDEGANWGNKNLSIKTCMQKFKIDKNCITNF